MMDQITETLPKDAVASPLVVEEGESRAGPPPPLPWCRPRFVEESPPALYERC